MASLQHLAHLKIDELFIQDTYLWYDGMLETADSQPIC